MIRRILLVSASAMALAGTAFAADLPTHAPPPVYLPPPPTWTGFYAGLNVGYAWSASKGVSTKATNIFDGYGIVDPADDESFASAVSQSGTASVNTGGVIGGGQIGYNYQFSPAFLVGIEADIQGLGQHGHGSFANTTPDLFGADFANAVVSSEKSVDWLGTVRGRLGWLITPTLLIYGDGGLAYGGAKARTGVRASWTPGGFDTAGDAWTGASGGFSQTRVGWTAGGGLEWMFMPNWSLKAEYLYYDLGSAAWGLSPNSSYSTISPDAIGSLAGVTNATNISRSSTRFNGNIVRVGLNYHFNWGGAPVVARY
jgi:outer membrane immunogenic protein